MTIEISPPRTTLDSFVLVHRTLIDGGQRLATALHRPTDGDLPGLARLWSFYQSGLAEHHEGESDVVFRLVAARDPEFARLEAEMADDHAEIDARLADADRAIEAAVATRTPAHRRCAAAAVDELVYALAEHLEREERLVLPRVVATIPIEEMNEIEKGFLRLVGLRRLALTVAALDSTARLEQLPMPPLPLPARLALPTWRRRYRRLLAGAGIHEAQVLS